MSCFICLHNGNCCPDMHSQAATAPKLTEELQTVCHVDLLIGVATANVQRAGEALIGCHGKWRQVLLAATPGAEH